MIQRSFLAPAVAFLLLANLSKMFAQQTFEFNRPGSSCYFQYVCFFPNNQYKSKVHPFIFVLGQPEESAIEAFNKDTLKNLPQFYDYEFIYIPNRGGDLKNRLSCIDGLTRLITFSFENGHSNVFLAITDPSISQSDVNTYHLNSIFKSVRLNGQGGSSMQVMRVEDDFKESVISYETESLDEDEKFDKFYFEEEKDETRRDVKTVNQLKTYFGPPETIKYTLTGSVRDKSTGEALPFATLLIKGTTTGIATNADGYFTLQKVPSDTSVLVVQYVGYERTEIYLSPQSPKKNLLIQVSPSSSNLKTVTVTGYKEDVVLVNKTDVSVIKMTPKKLEQLPNVGERDIMRSFQLMPGVSASNESSSGLYVRGGTPDQNLVLYDGFTVYQVDHLYGFFSAFNSNALKDVQLYKGGFESRFGGRLSSVTEITGKDGNQNKFNLGADLSLLSVNVFAEVPIGKKFTSVVTFRKSYKGLIYNKIFNKFNKGSGTTSQQPSAPQGRPGGGRQTQNSKVSSYFYDLNGKFTYRPNDKDIISVSVFNGTDKLDNSISSEAPSFGASNSNFSISSTDLTKYGNFGSSLKWSRKWTDKIYGNTILSYSNYYSNRDRSQERTLTNSSGETTTNKNGILENNNLKDYSLKSDYQWDIFNFSQLQFGGFATYYDINYTYAQSDTSTVLDKLNKAILAGGYLQSKTKLFNDRVQFLPGIRASYFESTKQMYYEPRASLSVNLTRRLTLKGAAGKYYQFANRVTREDILSGSKDFWLLSDDKSVPVSSSIHYIAGLSYETNSYLFSAEGYYKELKELTEYSLRFNPSPNGVSYDENFFTGYGYSKGIEFLVQKKSGNFNGWISYTLGEARNHFDVYADTYYPANQDVTHEFKIVALYKYKRWDFSATWIYATGRPYTAPSGAYSVTLLDGTSSDFFTVTTKNGLRLPEYHRCDLSANYKLLKGFKGDKKRREIGYLGFSIFNLYNRTNTWYKQYTIEDGGILETNINYLGITPNVTLSLKLR